MKGEIRNPTMVWLIGGWSCGLGALYFFYTMFAELKNYLGRDDINPLVEVLIAFLCAPYALMRLGGYIQEAKTRAGIANAQNEWMTYLAWMFLCLLGWSKIQQDLNSIWQGSGASPATF